MKSTCHVCLVAEAMFKSDFSQSGRAPQTVRGTGQCDSHSYVLRRQSEGLNMPLQHTYLTPEFSTQSLNIEPCVSSKHKAISNTTVCCRPRVDAIPDRSNGADSFEACLPITNRRAFKNIDCAKSGITGSRRINGIGDLSAVDTEQFVRITMNNGLHRQ